MASLMPFLSLCGLFLVIYKLKLDHLTPVVKFLSWVPLTWSKRATSALCKLISWSPPCSQFQQQHRPAPSGIFAPVCSAWQSSSPCPLLRRDLQTVFSDLPLLSPHYSLLTHQQTVYQLKLGCSVVSMLVRESEAQGGWQSCMSYYFSTSKGLKILSDTFKANIVSIQKYIFKGCFVAQWVQPYISISSECFEPQWPSFQSSFLRTCLGRRQTMAQVLGAVPLTWEIQRDSQALGPAWPSPSHCSMWKMKLRMSDNLPLSLSVTLPLKCIISFI